MSVNNQQNSAVIPSLSEINAMRKPELRQTLLNVLELEPWLKAAEDSRCLATSLASLAPELRKSNEHNLEMRDEIRSLKVQMSELQARVSATDSTLPLQSSSNEATSLKQPVPSKSFVDALRATVKDTFREEKAKSQVVISNVKEEGNDLQFMSSLCEKISHKSMPKNLSRMGAKSANHARPMVVTFDSNFDARTFMSRCDASKSDLSDLTHNMRIRPYRSSEEQAIFKSKLERVRDLNKKAKEESPEVSFSLRANGSIWKYTKNPASNKWTRDVEWSDSEAGGNEQTNKMVSGNEH